MLQTCVECWTSQVKLQPLAETHEILSIVADPLKLGWPIRRTRKFNASINRAKLVWVGPTDDQQLQSDFEDFFMTTLEADAGVFLVASDVEVPQEQCHLAARRGSHFLPPAADATSAELLSAEQVYAPGQLIRLGEYSDLRRQAGCTSAYFADLEQAATRGASTPGASLPCLLTHGTTHCWSPNRLVTPAELYLMHGFNRYPAHTKCPVPCRLNSFLSGLNTKDAKQLLGNGWHLPTLASFFFYILSHCVSLDQINQMYCKPERNLLVKGGSSSFENLDEAANEATEGSKRARQGA